MPLHKKQKQWNRDSKTFNPLNKTQWEEGSSFSITIALWKSKFPDKKKTPTLLLWSIPLFHKWICFVHQGQSTAWLN